MAVEEKQAEVRREFLRHYWIEKGTGNNNVLAFEYDELEMTVIFETLYDILHYPFWHTIHADFHFHRPKGDDSRLFQRYLHFIIRSKELKAGQSK